MIDTKIMMMMMIYRNKNLVFRLVLFPNPCFCLVLLYLSHFVSYLLILRERFTLLLTLGQQCHSFFQNTLFSALGILIILLFSITSLSSSLLSSLPRGNSLPSSLSFSSFFPSHCLGINIPSFLS